MKQKVRVVGIVKRNDGSFLFLKKNLGRIDGLVNWEFPTGKIQLGEQPDEALSRFIYENLGIQTSSIKLKDVVTFTAIDGISKISNLYILYDVILNENDKINVSNRYTAFKYVKFNNDVSLNFSDATLSILHLIGNVADEKVGKNIYRSVANAATVFVDGSSRGNPGPSGIGYYIVGEDGNLLKRGGEFIGFATSRVAEYYALKEGCEQAIEMGIKNVRFVSDNLMMVNQMNGIYSVKNKDLYQLYTDIQKLLPIFDACAFVHVNRIHNAEADLEANIAIDRQFGRKM